MPTMLFPWRSLANTGRLWDIFDSPLNDDDGLQLETGFDMIWDIILNENPDDMNDLWDHLLFTSDNTPADYGIYGYEIWNIFSDHGIEGTVNIMNPTQTVVASAGSKDNPSNICINVILQSPTDTSILPVFSEGHFLVKVGKEIGTVVAAELCVPLHTILPDFQHTP